MTRQANRDSEYCKSVDNLFGRFQFFYDQCTDVILNHSPPVAVSYIVEAIESLAPHVERHKKARQALLFKARGYSEKAGEAANG